MNLRVKRARETYFIPVERHSSFQSVKETISKICGENEITKENVVDPAAITLYKGPYATEGMKELPNNGTVSDHEVANDSIIFAQFNGEKMEVEGMSGESKEADPQE